MTSSTAEYALLSQDSYIDRKKGEGLDIGGIHYTVLDCANDPINGYQGVAYRRNDGAVVIAHRGTEQIGRDGVLTDGGMVLTGINAQTPDAMAFTKRVVEEARAYDEKRGLPFNVTVTGHSLGGTLAEITAYQYGLHGETFNAYGAACLLQGIPQGGHQIIDHVRATDVVSAGSAHFGEVHIYAAQQDIDHLTKAGYRDDSGILSPHNLIGAMDFGAHGIDNFVPDSKLLGHSIISPENEARFRAHHGMIDRYRGDVLDARIVASAQWEFSNAMVSGAGAFGHVAHQEVAQSVHAAEHGAQYVAHEAIQGTHAFEHGVQHLAHEIGEKGFQVAHAIEQAAQVTATEVSHAYDATHKGVVQGVHAAEHAISQGAHAAEHAVAQGLHAREHVARTLANDASKAWNTLSHPGSWFDGSPSAPAATPQHLDHPSHPDHALYQQARSAVHRLDAEHQRAPDQHSDNLAAALVVAARRDGLSQVNHAALSDDASRAFAVQGEVHSPLRQLTQVQTAQAANTSIEQSSLAWQQAASSKQADQVLAQQLISQQHDQQLQRAPHPMGM